MAKIAQRQLFGWRDVAATSDLERLGLVLDNLPDEAFVGDLEERRGKGRNDYPVRPCWNAFLASFLYGHSSAAALLRELGRNAELREVCGFDPHRGADAVPSEDAFGRFLASLAAIPPATLQAVFDRSVATVGELLPDFGRRGAADSKALSSFGKPVPKRGEAGEHAAKEGDRRRDHDADWGRKTYRGVHDDGTPWEKNQKWFGYKLHLLADSTYELPMSLKVTPASRNDSPELLPLVEMLARRHPTLAARMEECAADKGYDSAGNNAGLYDEYGIAPVIDNRHMWKDGDDRERTLCGKKTDSFVYNEDGKVFCVCPATGTKREMAYVGFEKDRKAQKVRCPAAAYGLMCEGRVECEAQAPKKVGAFGRTVRIPLSKDRRIFGPIGRNTRAWKLAYNRRTAVERVNSRIDNLLGFERHTVRGLDKMRVRITVGLSVMLAMAIGTIRTGRKEAMRTLVSVLPRAA